MIKNSLPQGTQSPLKRSPFISNGQLKISLLFLMICTNLTLSAQNCVGDCQNGFGMTEDPNTLIIGNFKNAQIDGCSMAYWKDSGAVVFSLYENGVPGITAVLFDNGRLEMGYRKNQSDGTRLYNGLDLAEDGIFSVKDGVRTKIDVELDVDTLLFERKKGMGYFFYDAAEDTAFSRKPVIIFGNFKNFTEMEGLAVLYNFHTGYLYVGTLMGSPWNGLNVGIHDWDVIHVVDGKESEDPFISFMFPDKPPGLNNPIPDSRKEVPSTRRVDFLKKLVEQ